MKEERKLYQSKDLWVKDLQLIQAFIEEHSQKNRKITAANGKTRIPFQHQNIQEILMSDYSKLNPVFSIVHLVDTTCILQYTPEDTGLKQLTENVPCPACWQTPR